jgi:hypothetical protein
MSQIAAMMQGDRDDCRPAGCHAYGHAGTARHWLAQPDARVEPLAGAAADPGATIAPHGVCERAAAPAATCLAQALAAVLSTRLARASSPS